MGSGADAGGSAMQTSRSGAGATPFSIGLAVGVIYDGLMIDFLEHPGACVSDATHKYGAYDTVPCMKTTVDIADDLLARAKALAMSRGTTLRDVIERGLRRELADTDTGYVLADATFTGSGLQAGIDEGDWSSMRELIFSGRGG